MIAGFKYCDIWTEHNYRLPFRLKSIAFGLLSAITRRISALELFITCHDGEGYVFGRVRLLLVSGKINRKDVNRFG